MIILENIIAKKYAIAFLNVYKDDIKRDDLEKIAVVENFLLGHKKFYLSLGIPSIPIKEKIEAIKRLLEHFDLKKGFENLFLLLLKHNRIDFLDRVLFQIRNCYRIKNNIKEFEVFTSQDVSEKEKISMLSFIKSKIEMSEIIAEFYKDPSLLVGVRFQSPNYLWEKSIRKQLRYIFNEMIEKGHS